MKFRQHVAVLVMHQKIYLLIPFNNDSCTGSLYYAKSSKIVVHFHD
jgi:hypothetical protein